ncbi:MAG: hypothetical protein QNJ54_29835 [Prochloraceae cyanobacterium]|nr:hypothetical protein [Prochloraceae cyanobacterium]
MFINGFDLPESNNGIVYFPGSPRQYRADCKSGIFKIGETDMLGNSLKMEVLGCYPFKKKIFNYPRQPWLEVFFIDKDNAFSNILFKTESINNFIELMRKLTLRSQTISTQIVTAKTAKRSSDRGTYYAVEFSASDNKPERIKQLIEFSKSEGNQLYSSRFADDVSEVQLVELEQLPPANNQKKLIKNSQELEDF